MRLFEVNVLNGVRLTRKYLPGMLKKNWGRVIFISSESGQHIPAEMIPYGMTKTAQVAVARGVAKSVAGTGVTVNSVLAGPTASECAGNFVASMAKQQNISEAEVEKQFFETVRHTSLLKRFESTEEVASVVAFVASTQAVQSIGLRCARKAASFAAFSSFDLGHYGGFPQVSGSFHFLGARKQFGVQFLTNCLTALRSLSFSSSTYAPARAAPHRSQSAVLRHGSINA